MGECLIIGQTGGRKIPELSPYYPADATIWAGETTTFKIEIVKQGSPRDYTYQWYKNGTAVEGANEATWTLTDTSEPGVFNVYCSITSKAGMAQSRTATLTVKNPDVVYTYSGDHEKIDDGNGNWRIKLKSSGNLVFTNLGKEWDGVIDVFLVGGGGGGGRLYNTALPFNGSGGGGGYTLTGTGIAVEKDTEYAIVIGAGGDGATGSQGTNVGGEGGTTTAFELSAAGGKGGNHSVGGAGASGGGSGARVRKDQDDKTNRMGYGGNGGSDGSDGSSGSGGYNGENGTPGKGQGTTTREFGESTGDLYAGGGGGTGYLGNGSGGAGGGGNADWSNGGGNGTANTGGGGGGGGYPAGAGGSGIVVIRNHREVAV